MSTTPEDTAKQTHQRCLQRWAALSPDQLAGTTMHGWEAHLPFGPFVRTPPEVRWCATHADADWDSSGMMDPWGGGDQATCPDCVRLGPASPWQRSAPPAAG